MTALHWAAAQGDGTGVALLLEAGASVDGTDDMGRSALHAGARSGSVSVIRLLLGAGASVGEVDARNRTALHEARSVEAVRALLRARADASACDDAGWSVLHVLAAEGGDEGSIAAVCGAGADVGAVTPEGYTAVHLAAGTGS